MQRRRSGAVCLEAWCRRSDGVSWAFGKVVRASCLEILRKLRGLDASRLNDAGANKRGCVTASPGVGYCDNVKIVGI